MSVVLLAYITRYSLSLRTAETDWFTRGSRLFALPFNFATSWLHWIWTCSRRYIGLARNLIRVIILPNQDDLSYPSRISFPGQQKLGKLPNTVSLAEQRRPVQTSHWQFFNGSNSIDTWGNLSNLWIPCTYLRPRNPSWIWIRYIQYATRGTTLCHPQNWLCRCDAFIPLSAPSSHFHLWATFMETTHASPQNTPDTQNSRWLQS